MVVPVQQWLEPFSLYPYVVSTKPSILLNIDSNINTSGLIKFVYLKADLWYE